MKVLVAVTNCWMYRKRQEAIRNTWLKDVPSIMDVRFFLGRRPQPLMCDNGLKEDEVQVDVDDGYPGLPAKTRAMCRYAREHGYTHLFKCDDDCYVRLDRLVASEFDKGDYIGRKRGPSGVWPAPYASGFSYWLSRRAFSIVADAQLTDDPAEDRWVGNVLHRAGMGCVPDYRYVIIMSVRNTCSHTEGPRKGNNIITACEFDADKWMNKLHWEYENLASIARTHQKVGPPNPLERVAVMVKTFLRDGYLIRAVEGIKKSLPESKIVIVDDGYESRFKIGMYSQLRRDGHSCAWLPFDSGFGAKANEAVKYCDREYVLIGSDDFAFGMAQVRQDVTRMVETLDQVADFDIVAGRVNNNPYESTLDDRGNEVFERKGYTEAGTCNAGTYQRCDLTVNYCLVRRTLLDRVRWDGDVKIGGGEHGMFFLDVKRAGGKVAYLPGVNINELPPNVPGWQHKDYGAMRARARTPGRPCALRRGVLKYWMGDTCEVSQ